MGSIKRPQTYLHEDTAQGLTHDGTRVLYFYLR